MALIKHFADWDDNRRDIWKDWGFQFLGMNENENTYITQFNLTNNKDRLKAFENYLRKVKKKNTNEKYLIIVHKTNVSPTSFGKEKLNVWLDNTNLYLFFISGGGVDHEKDLHAANNINLIYRSKPLNRGDMNDKFKKELISVITKIEKGTLK